MGTFKWRRSPALRRDPVLYDKHPWKDLDRFLRHSYRASRDPIVLPVPTSSGAILVYTSGVWTSLDPGSENFVLSIASGVPIWLPVNLNSDGVTGTLPIDKGGTASTTESTARTALGLEIGTDVASASHTHGTTDLGAAARLFDGSFVETIDIGWTESGGTVSLTLEASGGGDLTVYLGGTEYTVDCTPTASVALTAGTDTNPTLNYVYVKESGGTASMVVSTSDWPSDAHAPVATVLVQSASSVATDGPYKVHAWTDHINKSTENGHLSHLNRKLRALSATWVSGVASTFTSGQIATTAGVIYQLHQHTMPAIDMSTGDPLFIANDPTTPYDRITDMDAGGVSTDANGDALVNNRYYNFVLWGVVSEDESDCKLFMNLPTGGYTSAAQAESDDNNTAVYSFGSGFVGTAFLITRYVLQYVTSGGGSFSEHQANDLRGLEPSTSPGGGTITDHGNLSGLTDDDHTQYPLIAGGRAFNNNALATEDLTASGNDLILASAETLTADRTLQFDVGDATRKLTLGGNPILNGGTHSGTNTGDQTITLTGDVTGSGTGSFATTITAGAVDHGAASGLADDDHTQYALADGTRNPANLQPLDSDLTAIAALTTTSWGRALLELAGAEAARQALDVGNTEQHHVWFTDMLASGATQNGWHSSTSGTGAGTDQAWAYLTSAGGNVVGVMSLGTGTTSSGRCTLTTWNNVVLFNTGTAFVFEARVSVDNLSTASEEYRIEIGFGNSWSSPWPADSCVFRYDRATDGDFWSCVVREDGTETKTVTSTAPAAGIGTALQTLRMEVDSDGAEVRFYIDGSLERTETGVNIPSDNDKMGLGLTIVKSAGTTERLLVVDWTRFTSTRTAAR